MGIIEQQNTIAEIKKFLDGIVLRTTEVRISELEDRSIEFTQYEQQK